jgi:hypothetical protein
MMGCQPIMDLACSVMADSLHGKSFDEIMSAFSATPPEHKSMGHSALSLLDDQVLSRPGKQSKLIGSESGGIAHLSKQLVGGVAASRSEGIDSVTAGSRPAAVDADARAYRRSLNQHKPNGKPIWDDDDGDEDHGAALPSASLQSSSASSRTGAQQSAHHNPMAGVDPKLIAELLESEERSLQKSTNNGKATGGKKASKKSAKSAKKVAKSHADDDDDYDGGDDGTADVDTAARRDESARVVVDTASATIAPALTHKAAIVILESPSPASAVSAATVTAALKSSSAAPQKSTAVAQKSAARDDDSPPRRARPVNAPTLTAPGLVADSAVPVGFVSPKAVKAAHTAVAAASTGGGTVSVSKALPQSVQTSSAVSSSSPSSLSGTAQPSRATKPQRPAASLPIGMSSDSSPDALSLSASASGVSASRQPEQQQSLPPTVTTKIHAERQTRPAAVIAVATTIYAQSPSKGERLPSSGTETTTPTSNVATAAAQKVTVAAPLMARSVSAIISRPRPAPKTLIPPTMASASAASSTSAASTHLPSQSPPASHPLLAPQSFDAVHTPTHPHLSAIPAFLRAFLEQSTLSTQPQTLESNMAPPPQTYPSPAWSSIPPMQFPPQSQFAQQQLQTQYPHFPGAEHHVVSSVVHPPPPSQIPPSSDFHLLPSALLDESALSALAPAFRPTVHPTLTSLSAPLGQMHASHSAHNLAAIVPVAAELPTFDAMIRGSMQHYPYPQQAAAAASAAAASAQSVSALSESFEMHYAKLGVMPGSASAPSVFLPAASFGAMHPHAINGASSAGSSAGDAALIANSAAPANTNTNAHIADLLMRVVGALGSIETRLARVESGAVSNTQSNNRHSKCSRVSRISLRVHPSVFDFIARSIFNHCLNPYFFAPIFDSSRDRRPSQSSIVSASGSSGTTNSIDCSSRSNNNSYKHPRNLSAPGKRKCDLKCWQFET